ncbi:MAG: BadF/BadG/BcrA/BcrD ATPase family protein, partial [Pseudomonadota bacterium]
MADFYVGVDGGATHTRLRLADADGNTLAEARGARSSLTLGVEAAVRIVSDLLANACRRAFVPVETRPHIVCGLAGHRDVARTQAFSSQMWEHGSIEVVSDGYAALLGAHEGRPGTLLVAGTGSIGMRLDDQDACTQVGGWGFPIGDEGGGAWLGWMALREAVRAYDEPARDTRFLSDLRIRCGGGHNDIVAWLSHGNATQFAALAPHVVKAAAAGDAVARDLVEKAGQELERLALLLDPEGDGPIALSGGLAEPLHPYLPEALR